MSSRSASCASWTSFKHAGWSNGANTPRDRRVWLLYLTPEAHPSLDILRSLGEQTRAEALAGISDDDREKLMSVLDALHANLITACTTAVVDDEVHHG